tara:strand:+ start:209 stop:373 length:165 start_codon:yes stop_codon:yes gene_type:complete
MKKEISMKYFDAFVKLVVMAMITWMAVSLLFISDALYELYAIEYELETIRKIID